MNVTQIGAAYRGHPGNPIHLRHQILMAREARVRKTGYDAVGLTDTRFCFADKGSRSRGLIRPSFALDSPPSPIRGRGEGRAPMHPQPGVRWGSKYAIMLFLHAVSTLSSSKISGNRKSSPKHHCDPEQLNRRMRATECGEAGVSDGTATGRPI